MVSKILRKLHFSLNQPFREADFAKFNKREDEIVQMRNQYRQMQMQLESFEKTQAELEERIR